MLNFTKLPVIRKLSILVFTVLLLKFTTGCDLLGFGSNDEEPSISMPLIVKFNEMDSTNIVSVIDSFEISEPPTVSLEHAAQTTINPRQLEDAMIRFDGGNTSSEAVIFLYGVNPNTREFVGPGGAFDPDYDVPYTIIPEQIESNNIELNAFFVETIGEVPDEPINLNIVPDNDSINKASLSLDPSQHTLPARFALQVNEDDVGTLPPNFMVYVQLGNAKESQPDDPVGLLISRLYMDGQNKWSSDFFQSGVGGAGYGKTTEQPMTDFDYFIMVLN